MKLSCSSFAGFASGLAFFTLSSSGSLSLFRVMHFLLCLFCFVELIHECDHLRTPWMNDRIEILCVPILLFNADLSISLMNLNVPKVNAHIKGMNVLEMTVNEPFSHGIERSFSLFSANDAAQFYIRFEYLNIILVTAVVAVVVLL